MLSEDLMIHIYILKDGYLSEAFICLIKLNIEMAEIHSRSFDRLQLSLRGLRMDLQPHRLSNT